MAEKVEEPLETLTMSIIACCPIAFVAFGMSMHIVFVRFSRTLVTCTPRRRSRATTGARLLSSPHCDHDGHQLRLDLKNGHLGK